jgi:hypothetical protein
MEKKKKKKKILIRELCCCRPKLKPNQPGAGPSPSPPTEQRHLRRQKLARRRRDRGACVRHVITAAGHTHARVARDRRPRGRRATPANRSTLVTVTLGTRTTCGRSGPTPPRLRRHRYRRMRPLVLQHRVVQQRDKRPPPGPGRHPALLGREHTASYLPPRLRKKKKTKKKKKKKSAEHAEKKKSKKMAGKKKKKKNNLHGHNLSVSHIMPKSVMIFSRKNP